MSGVAEQAISMVRLVRTSGSEWFEREKYYKLDAPRVGLSLRNKVRLTRTCCLASLFLVQI